MNIFHTFLDALFPSHCLGCGAATVHGAVACARCMEEVPVHRTFFCGRCRARLADGKKICHPSFPYLLGAATDYDAPLVRELIHALKFNRITAAAEPLGLLLGRYAAALPLPAYAIIVPLPLSRRRLYERGFNQAEKLAEFLGERTALPVVRSALVRTRHTQAQSSTKGRHERAQNIAGCFRVASPEAIAEKVIILVDDVTTSGATLYEAAVTLKGAGAAGVIALTAAKA